MFVVFLLLLPVLVPLTATLLADPSPGLWHSKAEIRAMTCTRLTDEAARRHFPGRIPAASPREDFLATDAVLCRGAIMAPGERPARDDAVLRELSASAADIAAAAAALPELAHKTWWVDAFYPDEAVTMKTAFAVRVELVQRGLKVTDRVPVLASGDIEVLGRMRPRQAYPLACRRYHAEGVLGRDDALVAVVLLDPRETALHAGVCSEGHWRWLR